MPVLINKRLPMHLPLDFRSNFRELGKWYTSSHHIKLDNQGAWLMRSQGRSALSWSWPVKGLANQKKHWMFIHD